MTNSQKHLISILIDELKTAKSQYEVEIAMRYFWHIWYALEQGKDKNDIKQ